jgi:hypothetical protein
MRVRRVQGHWDRVQIEQWYLDQGQELKGAKFPKVGFIAEGVAAGFLYQTDGGFALVEGFITNPDAPMRDRMIGLEMVTELLILEAEKLGVKHLVGMTQRKSIGRLGKRHGFRDLGEYRMFAREI